MGHVKTLQLVNTAAKSNTQKPLLLLLMNYSCYVLMIIISTGSRVAEAWDCENSCAGVALSYPFGSGWNCGSPAFQPYVNCSAQGQLLFYTPTGTYTVQSIDYTTNTMVVMDPSMSTCSSAKASSSFGLPVGAPFSFAAIDTVALTGCSSVSSLYSRQTCDASSSASLQLCQSLYGNCGNAITSNSAYLGISVNSPSSSCCVVSNNVLNTAPYEIDLPLLQCVSYTSIYHMGSLQDPANTWLFGIALQFDPGSASSSSSGTSGQHPTCYICQEAEDSSSSIEAAPVRILMAIAGTVFLMLVDLLCLN